MEHPEFPSDETLAAFIDGRADPETRKRVIEHMVGCNDCYATFEAATAMRGQSGEQVVPFRKKRMVVIGLAAAAAVAVVVILTPTARDWLQSDRSALAMYAPEYRTIDGRLDGFPYRPLRPAVRGSATSSSDLRLVSRAARIQEKTAKNPSVANLHALGVAQLLLGNRDEAIRNLTEALNKETVQKDVVKAIQMSNDVPLLNDLSVSYATRASSGDLPLAVEASDRAWQLSHTPETAWNRAIALQSVPLVKRAMEAWGDYLKLDSASPWSDEARKFLNRLQKQQTPASADDSNCRQRWQLAVDALIAEWAPAVLREEVRRQKLEKTLYETGQDLKNGCRDALVADVLKGSSHKSAVALSALNEAIAANTRIGSVDATASFEHAAKLAEGTPAISLVGLKRSSAAFQSQRFEDANKFAQQVLSVPESSSYAIARANANWMRGLSLLASGDVVGARQFYARALASFAALSDRVSEARVCGLMAAAEEATGRQDVARALQARGINALSRTSRNDYIFFIVASSRAQEGLFRTARELLTEYLMAPDLESPGHLADAYCLRALVGSKTGSSSFAADLVKARQISTRIAGKDDRDRLRGYIALIKAMSSHTVQDIDDALRYYNIGRSPFVTSRLLFWRGLAEIDLGAGQAAELDFSRSIATLDAPSATLRNFDDKVPFVGTLAELFDSAIAVEIRRGAFARAFDVRERASQILLSDSSRRVTLDGVAAATPPGFVHVEYAVLPHELVTWVITRGSARTYVTRIESNALEDLVASARKTRDEQPASSRLKRLSEVMLAQVPLKGTTSVTFVPDKFLTWVPFASLVIDGRFLVEHCNVTLATCAANIRARDDDHVRFDSVVAVGNPLLPRNLLADLPPLPAAELEAVQIASAFANRTVLTGGDATVDRFLRYAPAASVIHFAGHAINDVSDPLNSSLVFSGAANDSLARLRARDLAVLKFPRTSLITLSSCSTAQGGVRAMTNIAQACLSAGVPNVLASLDDVNDTLALQFFRSFYENLHRNADIPSALREAQFRFLRSGNPALTRPSAWDTYVLYATSR